MATRHKPLVPLGAEIKSPPFSAPARREAGLLLRHLQQGVHILMPDSKSMPSIGKRCHELRIRDGDVNWRIFYRIDTDAILVVSVFLKKKAKTPKREIDLAKRRLREYDLKAKSTAN